MKTNIASEICKLEIDIYKFKLDRCLGVYQHKNEIKDYNRNKWKLNLLKNKEDEEFLKKWGLKKCKK